MVLANDLIKQISGDDAKKYFKTTFDTLQEKLLYNLVILGKYTGKNNCENFELGCKNKNFSKNYVNFVYYNFYGIPIKDFENLEL